MYEIRAPGAAPWRSGIDTAGQAYRLLAGAPPGCIVQRERDGVRVTPLGALVPERAHIEAVFAALPGTETDVATATQLPADLAMAALVALRDAGRARWAGWRWVAVERRRAA